MTMKWQDLVDCGEFNRFSSNYAQQSLKAGKTAEQAMMEFKLPEKFKGYTVTPGVAAAARAATSGSSTRNSRARK